jgi:hypothetical protein
MTNNQHPHPTFNYAEEKMKRKSVQIHAPKNALADSVRLRRVSRFLKIELQLAVELVCKLWPATFS